MKIEILGSGCQKCSALYTVAKQAAEELSLAADVVKVENFKDIMKYGVMTTPALVVDGKVKVAGRVPNKEEIKAMLQ